MTMMDEALRSASDTKECSIGPGAADGAAAMFRKLFPAGTKAVVIEDPRTREVAGRGVAARLDDAGVEVSEYVVNPDGSDFHATYEKVEDNMLVVTSRSKLYTEVLLTGDLPYTAESVLEQLTVKAMGLGILAEDAVLELYDSESGQATAFEVGSPLIAGTYRLKYCLASVGGADAYVYCVVTADMCGE